MLSSWGPYITTAGNVMGITTKPINVKASVSGRKVPNADISDSEVNPADQKVMAM